MFRRGFRFFRSNGSGQEHFRLAHGNQQPASKRLVVTESRGIAAEKGADRMAGFGPGLGTKGESGPWHCHLHLSDIGEVRFVVESDIHDPKREAYSVRFLNKEGQTPLMVFFGMHDKQGVLLSHRVDGFYTLKEKYSR